MAKIPRPKNKDYNNNSYLQTLKNVQVNWVTSLTLPTSKTNKNVNIWKIKILGVKQNIWIKVQIRPIIENIKKKKKKKVNSKED